jgi:hypothetical protein
MTDEKFVKRIYPSAYCVIKRYEPTLQCCHIVEYQNVISSVMDTEENAWYSAKKYINHKMMSLLES